MSESLDKRLEEVETIIRSCLLSRKGFVTIDQLNSDYKEYEEENIPFREFNYNSLYGFLSSLTNVLRMKTIGNETIIQVIDTERTRHVNLLVQGQKWQKSARKKLVFINRIQKQHCGSYFQV